MGFGALGRGADMDDFLQLNLKLKLNLQGDWDMEIWRMEKHANAPVLIAACAQRVRAGGRFGLEDQRAVNDLNGRVAA